MSRIKRVYYIVYSICYHTYRFHKVLSNLKQFLSCYTESLIPVLKKRQDSLKSMISYNMINTALNLIKLYGNDKYDTIYHIQYNELFKFYSL